MHQCKRIIDGKTYNTETSTRLAGWDNDEGPYDAGQHLYLNRYGAFFLYDYASDGPYGPEENPVPLTPDQTRKWLEEHRSHEVDLFESLFGKQPEAGSGEVKYTLRMPESLRDRLAAAAKGNKQSLNAWIIRCLERCIEPIGNSTDGERR